MDRLKQKFLMMVSKKKPADATTVFPVRVNLPTDLGGGFTVRMLNLASGQSVADFIKSLIVMLQTTNAVVLHAHDFGLTPSVPRDANGLDGQGMPPVFLKPDSLLADALEDGEEDELELDLRRLKPAKRVADQGRTIASGASDATGGSSGTTGGMRTSTTQKQRLPTLPTPPAQTVLQYNCLSKLKRLRPPVDAPPEVLVVSTLVPPCCLPPHLAASLPEELATGAFHSSLQARASSTAAAAAIAATSSAAMPASASLSSTTAADAKKAAKAEATLKRQIDAYANHVYDLLLARGVGQDPHLELQLREAAKVHAAKSAEAKGERIGTTSAATGADGRNPLWGGWEEQEAMKRLEQTEHSLEVPLLFVSTKKMPTPLPKKFDVTTDCFVVTNHRCLQIENGVITTDLPLGADSGNIIKLPKHADDGDEPGRCPIDLIVKNAVDMMRDEHPAADDATSEMTEQEIDAALNGDDTSDTPAASRSGRRRNGARATSRVVSFFVPTPEIAGFLEEYLIYLQEKSLLESQLGLLEQARLDRVEHAKTERCLKGWTYLLRSLVGPIIFGPLRQPVYENSIKQVLAKVQQMDLKQVKITSLKLLEFKIPELDASAPSVAAYDPHSSFPGSLASFDQIPSLRLIDYLGHPHHEYAFDIFWSAPSFYIKLEISGKKLVSFKLELEMRGVEVRGTIRLRSSPYEPEKAAVSFVQMPQLSFGVGSHVIVGSVKLPFQRAIEKIIYTQIQAAIENGMREKIVGDCWQSIYFEKSGLSLLLDRWSSIAQYPFQFDGTDDEDMMSLALVVTSQAESGLSEVVREMRTNRERMQKYLGQRDNDADALLPLEASPTTTPLQATPLHSRKSSRAEPDLAPPPMHRRASSRLNITSDQLPTSARNKQARERQRERDGEAEDGSAPQNDATDEREEADERPTSSKAKTPSRDRASSSAQSTPSKSTRKKKKSQPVVEEEE